MEMKVWLYRYNSVSRNPKPHKILSKRWGSNPSRIPLFPMHSVENLIKVTPLCRRTVPNLC